MARDRYRPNSTSAPTCGSSIAGQVLKTSRLVTFQLDIKRVISRKLNMAIADGTMFVDGREIYTAEDLRVGLFTSTDNF